jgi:hypothetical protein
MFGHVAKSDPVDGSILMSLVEMARTNDVEGFSSVPVEPLSSNVSLNVSRGLHGVLLPLTMTDLSISILYQTCFS